MALPFEIETQLQKFHAETLAAQADATARLGNSRRAKLGDLNIREGLYEEVKPLFRRVYHDANLRYLAFGRDALGMRSRRLLLVFMSELIYWEYDRSFWDKLYEVLELDSRSYSWFTEQMLRGYEEGGIPLIKSYNEYSERREFVRTIVAESGFSRRLVDEAKRFVIWFFDQHSDFDPRFLDAGAFDRVLTDYGVDTWDKTEVYDLLRNMVEAVSRLLREIRRRSFASADFRNPKAISELESALGFHPVRGIFGFRREEDIQELIERLSTRVRPETFYTMLERKIRFNTKNLWVTLPEGQIITVGKASDVPIVYGEYKLRDPYPSEVQVVPREALTLAKLEEMLRGPKRAFYQDGPIYAYIHDDQPFEVYKGAMEPDEARRYHLSSASGYLWYGKRRIGTPLRAERDGRLLADLTPRRDIWLNPRIRLSWDKTAIEVVIPSFICYEPRFGGKTVLLELNGRPIEDTTYVIGLDGSLQFQSTRVSSVLPTDEYLEVALVTLDNKQVITKETVASGLRSPLLFRIGSRESVTPGTKYYGGTEFVLFIPQGNTMQLGAGIDITGRSAFGKLEVLQLRWGVASKDTPSFELTAGDRRWLFSQPLEIYASVFCAPSQGILRPRENIAAFSPDDVHVKLHLAGQADAAAIAKDKLYLIIEKDGEFLADLTLTDLEKTESLWPTAVQGEFGISASRVIRYLHSHHLIDREIGSYSFVLMFRPEPARDLESLSELEFMILPRLRVEGADSEMMEGDESLVTVLCEAPLLADEDGRSVSVLRVNCRPEADYDPSSHRLVATSVRKTIRLTYPPAKLDLTFVPSLFAVRLASEGRTQQSGKLTHKQMSDSILLVLAPPDSPILVKCGEEETHFKTDSTGQTHFALRHLEPAIRDERTDIEIRHLTFSRRLEVIWHASARFVHEKCSFTRISSATGRLELAILADGPPSAEATFKLVDNRFRSHGQSGHSIGSLKQGRLDLSMDPRALSGAKVIFCTVLIKGERQDTVQISCEGGAQEDFDAQLASSLS